MIMRRDIAIRLDARQTAVLILAAGATIGIAASQVGGIASLAASFIAICSEFLVAGGSGASAPKIAAVVFAWSLIGASLASGAMLVVRAVRQRGALHRQLQEAGTVSSGKVERAADAVGMEVPTVIDDVMTPYAFTVGLLRPSVVVSSGLVRLLSLSELKAVLRHERQHQRRFDPLRAFAGELLRATMFWMPVLRDIMDHCALSREIGADKAAASGKGGPRALASALLKASAPAPAWASGAVMFGRLSHRVDAIAHPSDRTPLTIATWRLAATVAVLAALLTGGGAVAAATVDDGTHLCTDAAARTATVGFTPFVRIMTDAAPMSEAGQMSPDIR